MTELEISSLKKLYYTIGEVSKLFDVNTSLIRFWEKEFDFEASKKTQKGNRLYTAKDIEKFNKIYHLVKIEGFTLEGAKKSLLAKNIFVKKEEGNHTNSSEIVDKLENIKRKLLALKK